MYTRCPGCGSVFEIDEHALLECGGDVECGVCNTRFDANQALADSAEGFAVAGPLDPPEFDRAVSETDASVNPVIDAAPALDEAVDLPMAEDESVFDELLEDMDAAETEGELQSDLPFESAVEGDAGAGAEAAQKSSLGDEPPRIVVEQKAPGLFSRPWSIHAEILALLLVLQLLAVIKLQLADDRVTTADQSPAKPPWQLVERAVRPHPDRSDALVLHVVIRNATTHAVDYPDLRLELTDTASKPIAERVFSPGTYLQSAAHASKLSANALLPVTLSITRPRRPWGGFQVQLLPHK